MVVLFFLRREVFVSGSDFGVDVIEGSKNGQGEIDVPNGNIIVWRTRAAGDGGYGITNCLVEEPVDIE